MPKILIPRDDHLGDLILTTGLMRNLVRAGHHVEVLCKAAWASAFDCHPLAAVHGFGEAGVPSSADSKSLGRWIRQRHYDHLLIPYRDRRLFAASWRSGVPHRWAQMGGIWSRLTFHRNLPAGILRRPRHMADVWLDFARALKIPVDDGHPELFLTEQERASMTARVKEHLGENDYIVIHPFHGRSSCNWPPAAYADLALQLRQAGIGVIITGNTPELAQLEPYRQKLEAAGVWISCGEFTLRQFFAVIGQARLLVCSSTGALHVSSALNVPSVSLFCPHPFVNQGLWGSFTSNSQVLSPPEQQCPRFEDPAACKDCGFAGSLPVSTVFDTCQNTLRGTVGSAR